MLFSVTSNLYFRVVLWVFWVLVTHCFKDLDQKAIEIEEMLKCSQLGIGLLHTCPEKNWMSCILRWIKQLLQFVIFKWLNYIVLMLSKSFSVYFSGPQSCWGCSVCFQVWFICISLWSFFYFSVVGPQKKIRLGQPFLTQKVVKLICVLTNYLGKVVHRRQHYF